LFQLLTETLIETQNKKSVAEIISGEKELWEVKNRNFSLSLHVIFIFIHFDVSICVSKFQKPCEDVKKVCFADRLMSFN
jgi:hypothetical protein